MGFLDWFKREKRLTDYTAEDLRREEGRLAIRESQIVARLQKLEGEKEEVFRQGFEVKSPVRRRALARKYVQKQTELGRVEREFALLAKEALAVSAIRFRLERRSKGESSILRKVGASEIEKLRTLYEDDSIDEEMFAGRLAEILGAVEEEEGDPLAGLGEEARSVMDIWQRMDEGTIGSVAEGLSEARERTGEVE